MICGKKVNLGVFQTPSEFVSLASGWLGKFIDSSYAILDSSCGDGAFFALKRDFQDNRFIGNDVDSDACLRAAGTYPFVEFHSCNALVGVDRAWLGIRDDEKLCIVSNPPYNDTTSQIRNNIKRSFEADPELRTRDIGISFLRSYEKLAPDYCLLLHPLSYLVKLANFRLGLSFFNHYQIKESLVLSSSEFVDTGKTPFPVIMALYGRSREPLTYEQIWDYSFETKEGQRFRLSQWDYISDYIDKYPSARRYEPELLFYTQRDINALIRSRTFLTERIANAVDVDPSKLAYYCYLDVFKQFVKPAYWMGNLNVPFIVAEFHRYSDDIVAVSKHLHPEVFGVVPEPNVERVLEYLEMVLDDCCVCTMLH